MWKRHSLSCSQEAEGTNFQSLSQSQTSSNYAVPSNPSYTVPPAGDKVFKNKRLHARSHSNHRNDILNLPWFLEKILKFYFCV